MPRHRPLSGRETIKALKRLGFVEKHREGSHVFLQSGNRTTTVPDYRDELARGTFKAILRQTGLTEKELHDAL